MKIICQVLTGCKFRFQKLSKKKKDCLCLGLTYLFDFVPGIIWLLDFKLIITCIFFSNQYISQKMHLIKYSSGQVSNSYLLRHRGVVLRDSSRTKEFKTNTVIQVLHPPTAMIKIFFFLAPQPPVGQGLLIHEVSRSNSATQLIGLLWTNDQLVAETST